MVGWHGDEWARSHRQDLMKDWELAKGSQPLVPIAPLEQGSVMDFEITHAEHLNDYKIKLKFTDGSSGIVDLSNYVSKTNVFKTFEDISHFKKFHVEYGTVPNAHPDSILSHCDLHGHFSGCGTPTAPRFLLHEPEGN
jgi:hypothetical protein